MEKTIKVSLVEFLRDTGNLDEFMKNLEVLGFPFITEITNISEGFPWDQTPQGQGYWDSLQGQFEEYEKVIEAVDEPTEEVLAPAEINHASVIVDAVAQTLVTAAIAGINKCNGGLTLQFSQAVVTSALAGNEGAVKLVNDIMDGRLLHLSFDPCIGGFVCLRQK